MNKTNSSSIQASGAAQEIKALHKLKRIVKSTFHWGLNWSTNHCVRLSAGTHTRCFLSNQGLRFSSINLVNCKTLTILL